MTNVDLHPRILSLCSGIGGLDLGIGLAIPGARTVCFVEREYPVCEVLEARMEEGAIEYAPIHSDLRSFDGEEWRGRVDIVAAGYPCQPFSVAGKRQGEEDERHLWPEVRRIIGEVGPSLVVLENVAGHLRLGFDRVLGELADLGFDAEWSLVRASDVGAPHRRERLFVLAYSGSLRGSGWGGPGELACQERRAQDQEEERQRGRDSANDSFGGVRSEWPPGPDANWEAVPSRLWPATQPSLRGVADGLPGRMDRLRALGNAVVPQQAAHAIRGLLKRALED
jgi:DNA (cytosine-5)-methyltransferase 1